MTITTSMFEITIMAVLIGAGFQFGLEVMRILWVVGRAVVAAARST
jgi:hypothetical protein